MKILICYKSPYQSHLQYINPFKSRFLVVEVPFLIVKHVKRPTERQVFPSLVQALSLVAYVGAKPGRPGSGERVETWEMAENLPEKYGKLRGFLILI